MSSFDYSAFLYGDKSPYNKQTKKTYRTHTCIEHTHASVQKTSPSPFYFEHLCYSDFHQAVLRW